MRKLDSVLKGLVTKRDENSDEAVLEAAVGSDETEDRHGDVLPMDKWDIRNFKKNPVLLDLHSADQTSESVIGKVEKIWFEDGKLMFRPRFAVDENPRAKTIFDLFKGGFMNAFSVGFMYVKDKKDQIKMELLEISAVPVPANPNALVAVKAAGVKTCSWDDVQKAMVVKSDKNEGGVDLQMSSHSDILDNKRRYYKSLSKLTS